MRERGSRRQRPGKSNERPRRAGPLRSKSRRDRYGQEVGNASVASICTNGVSCGLLLVYVTPVVVSSTCQLTITLVRPAAKTQYALLIVQPFRTFTTISMFVGSKNQKYPELSVSWTAVAAPVVPSLRVH